MKKRIKKPFSSKTAILLFILFMFIACPVPADELSDVLAVFDDTDSGEEELSDILSGFEEDDDTRSFDETASYASDMIFLSGSVGTAGAVNLSSHKRPPETNDRKGLAKLRCELDLTVDMDLGDSWKARAAGHGFYDLAYRLRDRDNYMSGTLDEYEKEAELGEIWIQGSPLQGLDIKIGRQVVVWGKSDNIRVTDILNPMDMREPGMTDIEDLRLPVTMSRLDYSFKKWTVTGIVVHEIRFNKLPVYGSDYYSSSIPLPDEKKPDFSLNNQEYALAVNGIFSGWEASFYAARVFEDSAHPETVHTGAFKRVHARITMLGTAVNLAAGNWLYKTEAALLTGLEFTSLPGENKSRLDVLAGIEYAGFTDTSISLEAANRHIFDFEDAMSASPGSAEENDFQWAFRMSRDFFHERLNALLLVQAYDLSGDGGMLGRMEFTCDLSDNWEAAAGLVLYQSGDRPTFKDINECNRIFFRLHYSF